MRRKLSALLLATTLVFCADIGPGSAQAPAAPAAQAGPSQGDLIFKAALAASRSNPAKWDWPPAASEAVRQQIIDGHYTREELRNIYTILARSSGDHWPSKGGSANHSMAAITAPDMVNHGRGFRELEVFYGSNGYGGIPDRVNRVDTLIAHGNRVFISWLIDGHHTGKLFGFPGDGKKVAIRESNLATLKDGKVVESEGHGDDYGLYVQAGGKISFPDKTPRTGGPARNAGAGAPGQPGPSKGDLILQAAAAASKIAPAKWDWPAAASPDVRQQIIAGHYSRAELGNIYMVLARSSGDLWPSSGPQPANRNMDVLNWPGAVFHGNGFKGLEESFGSNGYGGISGRVNKVDTLIAHGDRVYISWIIDGRHTGKTFGFPGDDKQIDVRESTMLRLTGGRIVEGDYNGDDLALYTQVGGKLSFPDKTP